MSEVVSIHAAKTNLSKLIARAEAGEEIVIAAASAGIVAQHGFIELPVSIRQGQLAGSLPGIHKDPFDRMLVAQAIVADMTIVSTDEILSAYGVARLW